jgi:Tfp pilus assembly protein FimT
LKIPVASISFHAPAGSLACRAFTTIELLAVLLIMSIVSVLGIDTVATFEANQRADRAAREALGFFRYARTLALTTGKNSKVQIDTSAKTLSVYWMSNGTSWDANPVSVSFVSGGIMLLNFAHAPELKGTSFTVTPSGTTAFVFGPTGACATAGTLQFTFGTKAKSLVIPSVGDPQLN